MPSGTTMASGTTSHGSDERRDRMDLDASVLLKKVMEQVLLRCVQAAPATGDGSAAGDPVDVFAGRLAGYVMTLLGGDGGGADGRPSRDELERAFAEIAARDRIVARALGACACWG